MGKLIDRNRRLKAKEAKQERMRQIRAEAVNSFSKLPFVEITLDAIGRRAGVKKGVASMYFGSREELFLELLRNELEDWYRSIERTLKARPGRLGTSRVARLLAKTLAERPVLTRLLSLAPVVLEQNMEVMSASSFQSWQRERMTSLGAEIERRHHGLERGDGLRLMHRLQLMAAAFHPYAHPQGTLAIELADPDMAALAVDLRAELESVALQVLNAGDG